MSLNEFQLILVILDLLFLHTKLSIDFSKGKKHNR